MADEFTKAALYGIKTFNRKAKEKIGMQKLIELFKEYVDKYSNDAKVLDEGEYVVIDDGQSFLYGTREYSYLTLISKKFGFIQWLVENDKIDKSKVFSFIDTADKPYEDILCLLALSDEPINDLISYLK